MIAFSANLVEGQVVKCILLAAAIIGAAASSTGAMAGDVPGDAAHDWTGFYLGAYGGVAWGDADIDGTIYNDGPPPAQDPGLLGAVNAIADFSFSDTFGAYGLQAGYNLQSDSLVFGIQADFGGLDFGESGDASGNFSGLNITVEDSFDTNWILTVRPRIGMLASDNLLIYATGGAALASIKFSHAYNSVGFFSTATESFSETDTQWGWVAGAGMEYAINDNLSFGAEYLYMDFGSISETNRVSASSVGPLNTLFKNELDLNVQTVRASLNYKF
jgi:outer membrane immunogenic protein